MKKTNIMLLSWIALIEINFSRISVNKKNLGWLIYRKFGGMGYFKNSENDFEMDYDPVCEKWSRTYGFVRLLGWLMESVIRPWVLRWRHIPAFDKWDCPEGQNICSYSYWFEFITIPSHYNEGILIKIPELATENWTQLQSLQNVHFNLYINLKFQFENANQKNC